jgi:hypothetical protein
MPLNTKKSFKKIVNKFFFNKNVKVAPLNTTDHVEPYIEKGTPEFSNHFVPMSLGSKSPENSSKNTRGGKKSKTKKLKKRKTRSKR